MARLACAGVLVCALTAALGAATASAQASFLNPVKTFGTQGSGSGQFQTPVGVAIDQLSGNVYVADSANARVDKFDANGNFIAAYGWGVADGKAQSEVCLAPDQGNQDQGNPQPSPASCRAGIAGSGAGQFSNPTSVAVVPSAEDEAQGTLYVGDASNAVVEKFTTGGSFESTIDGTTTPQGHFSSVAGVSVDQSDNLWVADANTDNITEFTPHGAFVRQWNDTFGSTVAIAVDSTHGLVYLIRGAGTTQSFSLTGTPVNNGVDNGSGRALALDPKTGNLYVGHGGDVAIYNPSAIRLDSLTLATSNSQGMAFRSTGPLGKPNLYVSDASANNVTVYSASPGPPFVLAETAMQTGKTTETLNGSVVPAGHDTTCVFQFVSDADFMASGYTNATTVPCTPADLGSSFAYTAASADLTGLTSGATYHFHVIAKSSAGTTTGADATFTVVDVWDPFNRCPVDDPAMLATTGASSIDLGGGGTGTISLCVASHSTNGSIKIGNVTTPTGNTDLQFGWVFDNSTGNSTLAQPAGGAVVGDPVNIMVGTASVTAQVQSAGPVSDFNLINGISLGQPIITVPIKIQLTSTALPLGPSCFIGSEQNPIVLHPANTDLSNASLATASFDANGVPDPMGDFAAILVSGAVQGDSTFAVPGATGCGANDSLDGAVNAVAGLPSASGNNNLVLDNASSDLAVGINLSTGVGLTGQQFAAGWHTNFG